MNAESKAPAAVAQMIAAVGIKRIVCVDDRYSQNVDLLLERLAGLTAKERASLLQVGPEVMEIEDVWQQRVREAWEKMGADERATLMDNVAALEHDFEPAHNVFADIVGATGVDSEVQRLSLADWRQQMKEVVGEAPTLILFDQDYSGEGGAEKEGQKLVAQLENEIRGQDEAELETFYGILTNTVDIDQEHIRRKEMVAEAGLDPGRFVLISKQSLQGDASLLPERLRPVLLAPLFARLMEEVGKAVLEAQKVARERAVDIPPEDLERMVVRTSNHEGVWPPDTLLRILETMQRETVRRSLREEGSLLGVAERVEALTNVALSTAPDEDMADEVADDSDERQAVERIPVAAEISNEEIYESADHLNSLHLPIDLGDLFENTETGKVYALIAQPCNLMVREKGVRAHEPTHMLLAKIAKGDVGQKTQAKFFELPYFDTGTGESHYVDMASPAVARSLILDSCVFNADGVSRLDLNSEEPGALLPHWRERREELRKRARAMLGRLDRLNKDVNLGADTRDTIGGWFKGDPFPLTDFSVEDELIAWNCVRIGRIRDPYARALLSSFSQYFSRDAYLHDLGG